MFVFINVHLLHCTARPVSGVMVYFIVQTTALESKEGAIINHVGSIGLHWLSQVIQDGSPFKDKERALDGWSVILYTERLWV